MSGTLYYTAFPCTPMPRKTGFGSWEWTLRDGACGMRLAEGTAWCRWAAFRAQAAAERRCVRHEPGTPFHPLTHGEARAITFRLWAHRIPVAVLAGARVDVYPLAPVTTEQEVEALRAVLARTDAPVRWAGAAR